MVSRSQRAIPSLPSWPLHPLLARQPWQSPAADALDPAGVYFGTRSGKLYGSADGGDTWAELADGLPSITCVKAAVVGAPPH